MAGPILALGGGGFESEPDDPRIDDFALGLCQSDRPRVCYLPTASGDDNTQIDAFYAAFSADRATPSHLSLFRRQRKDLRRPVMAAELIYIGGGSTPNLLALWRLHGLDQLVIEAWRAGAVIVGHSAGACCLFEGCLTRAFGPALTPHADGLGILPGSFCPHYDGPKYGPRFRQVIGEGFAAGFGVEDGTALHFVDGGLHQVLLTRPEARAFRVFKRDRVTEEPLSTVALAPR